MEARGTIAYNRDGEEYRIIEERFELNSTRVSYDTFYLYAQVRMLYLFNINAIVATKSNTAPLLNFVKTQRSV